MEIRQKSGNWSMRRSWMVFINRRSVQAFVLVLCAANILTALAAPAKRSPATVRRAAPTKPESDLARARYGRLPLALEPNRGQADARAKYVAHTESYTLFLTARGALFSPFQCPKAKRGACWARMVMVGANPAPVIYPADQLPGRTNYLIGRNPRNWRTDIPLYARVVYRGIYPGIRAVYHGNPGQLEYDFIVAPRADAGRIRFAFGGPDGRLALHLSRTGDLEVATRGGTIRVLKPVAFQPLPGGARRLVRSRYVISGRRLVSVDLGAYNHSQPLVIDPALAYSSFLGGSGGDSVAGIALDSSGNAYVTGATGSTNFPISSSPAPYHKSLAGASNAFVTEIKPGGTGLVYSTYVGGTGSDFGTGIAVDPSGNAYVTGYTTSPDFPGVKGFYQAAYNGAGKDEAFVFELKAGGAALNYATYIGGSGGDFANGIALDSLNDAYVAGSTQSSDFPCTNKLPQSLSLGASQDAFVFELDPKGMTRVYGTCLGGS
ncbi:MAG: SBBP repeat-containing protein, partial [Terriglobia bacterium]